MKQMLCCPLCAKLYEEMKDDPEIVEAGETITLVRGSSRDTYRCDGCNQQRFRGNAVVAIGVIAPGQDPHKGWETRYVRTVGAVGYGSN